MISSSCLCSLLVPQKSLHSDHNIITRTTGETRRQEIVGAQAVEQFAATDETFRRGATKGSRKWEFRVLLKCHVTLRCTELGSPLMVLYIRVPT